MGPILSVLHAWPYFILLLLLTASIWQLLTGPTDDRRRRSALILNAAALLLTIVLAGSILAVRSALREHEQTIGALQNAYDTRAAEVERYRAGMERAAGALNAAQEELLRARSEAGRAFDRAAAEIRKEYGNISDAELSRRIDAILRRARNRMPDGEATR